MTKSKTQTVTLSNSKARKALSIKCLEQWTAIHNPPLGMQALPLNQRGEYSIGLAASDIGEIERIRHVCGCNVIFGGALCRPQIRREALHALRLVHTVPRSELAIKQVSATSRKLWPGHTGSRDPSLMSLCLLDER